MLPTKYKIEINDLEVYAYHGCLPSERKNGGKYTVSVSVEFDFSAAFLSDNIKDTLDYEKIISVIEQEMATPSHLIEHVAGRIYKAIKKAYPQAKEVSVSIQKHTLPLSAKLRSVGVKII